MTVYALTVFLGSFLLFQIQPLIGKYILPWYGGSPAVWTTCMLFFQVALLAGYGYAYLSSRLSGKRQAFVHALFLAGALLFIPIAPSADFWASSVVHSPQASILLLLTATIGLPYFTLSATAPLVQHWFVRSCPGRSPYRLYALSNAGSFIALLSYPILIEPRFLLNRQIVWWGWVFVVFVLCCGWCLLRLARTLEPDFVSPAGPDEERQHGNPASTDIVKWLLLSACGSGLLLATTNQLCQEVAVIPFLWIVPLALYLITFIVCFNSERACDRLLWGILLAASVGAACRVVSLGVYINLPIQILILLAALFTSCMVCHGELARSSPDPRHLTVYYLIIAPGGAAGGIFVALVAPSLFKGF